MDYGHSLEFGFGTFVLIAPPDPETLRTFIEDVAPQVRERVAAERALASTQSPEYGASRA